MRPGARHLLDLVLLQPDAVREREALVQQSDAREMADERAAVGAIVIARDRGVSFRLVHVAEDPELFALGELGEQTQVFLRADLRRRRPKRPRHARMAPCMTLALALDALDQLARAAAAFYAHRGAAAQRRRNQLVPEGQRPATGHIAHLQREHAA